MTDRNWIEMIRQWNGNEHFHIVLILVAAFALYKLVKHIVPFISNRMYPESRYYALPWIPILRLIIIIAAVASIIPLVIIPTRENILVLIGAFALAIGFILKDYMSCLFAGIILISERAYRVGDWIQIGDTYGEVIAVGLRATKLRTAEANDVSIAHSMLWHEPLINATNGERDVLCVIDFFINPVYCNGDVRDLLINVTSASRFIKKDRPVIIMIKNEPFGLHYKVKAYSKDARDQFQFMADITERGNIRLEQSGIKLISSPVSITP